MTIRTGSLKRSKYLLGYEVSGVAPFAGHDKFADGFADARRGFAIAIGLRKGSGIAGIADGKGCECVPAGRNLENFARGVRIKTGHLVNQSPREVASVVSWDMAAPVSYCALRLGVLFFAKDNAETAKPKT